MLSNSCLVRGCFCGVHVLVQFAALTLQRSVGLSDSLIASFSCAQVSSTLLSLRRFDLLVGPSAWQGTRPEHGDGDPPGHVRTRNHRRCAATQFSAVVEASNPLRHPAQFHGPRLHHVTAGAWRCRTQSKRSVRRTFRHWLQRRASPLHINHLRGSLPSRSLVSAASKGRWASVWRQRLRWTRWRLPTSAVVHSATAITQYLNASQPACGSRAIPGGQLCQRQFVEWTNSAALAPFFSRQ